MSDARFKIGDIIEFYWELEKSTHRAVVQKLNEDYFEVNWENDNFPGMYAPKSPEKHVVSFHSLVGRTARILGNIFERAEIHELTGYDS